MKVLNNLGENHYAHIQELIKRADEFIIVSPFLTETFEESIHDIAQAGIKKIILVTTLKDNNPDLFKKVNSLYTFCTSCIINNVSYQIRIDNKLHGKLYIAMNKDIPTAGIITSANFTENGLYHSHEWGVEIDDTNELQNIIKDVFSVSSNPLSYIEIEEIIKNIDEYLKNNKVKPEPELKLEISKLLTKEITKTTAKEIRYFIKPVGYSEDPFTPGRLLDRNIEELHFSKRRPAAVRPGDILICYGVGSTKLLGYFEVLTEPVIVRDDDSRWPWGVAAKNLCPNYSDGWFKYNNTISSIQSSYSDDLPLTYVGGKSLGALNFGADKIQLNSDFAKHIIGIFENSLK